VTSVYPWKGAAAETFALQQRAQLAGLRGEARYSLSPTSFLDAERGLRCVLSSPNGVELTLRAAQTSAVVLAGCLRNAAAVARVAQLCGHTFNVCPAGERWSDGSLRPAIEDWLAAGAIIASLPGPRSPEAAAAKAAFESVRGILPATLAASSSGRELIERGFSQDVELAAELNVSAHVPRFVAGAFVAVTSPGTLRREGPAR
jgi:2-phosphosulfolactate phosphatase